MRPVLLILVALAIACGCAHATTEEDHLCQHGTAEVAPPEASPDVQRQVAIDPAFAEWHLPVIEAAAEEWFQVAPSQRVPVVIGTEGSIPIRYVPGQGPLEPDSGVRRLGQFGAGGIAIWSDWMKTETLRAVVLHELGHAFGAGHLPADADPRAVMHATIDGWPGQKCITPEDLGLLGLEGEGSCHAP